MTPEEAQDWISTIQYHDEAYGDDAGMDDLQEALRDYATDMLDTIAACRIEYGVEVRPDEHSEWQHAGPWWDTPEQARAWRGRATLRIGQPHTHDRIVHRLVGPVEVVE